MTAPSPVRAALDTLGCRVNFSETDGLRAALAAAGYQLVDFGQVADVYVVNTCTVTHVADRKSRQLLRRAARRNPQALVVAVGCYADADAAALRAVQGVDLVVGREEEPFLVERIAAALRERGLETPRRAGPRPALLPAGAARALVKVQDGCDNRCAYCIVGIVRGPGRSRPAGGVIAEVRQWLEAGYPEIILTGINLGRYHDPQIGGLADLVRLVLAESAVRRVRLSSIEPQDAAQVLDLWPDERLCRHLHLPLQSGCDATLARMRRPYRRAAFRALAEQLRRRLPAAGLTSDIIVGFPGETEDEFAVSMAAVATLPFSDLHIFPFSPRPGTAAAAMPDAVPPAVIRRRCGEAHDLANRLAHAFRQRFLGQELTVLWDGRVRQGWTGLSDNYLRVVTSARGDWLGQVTRTRLTALEGTTLIGEPVGRRGGDPMAPAVRHDRRLSSIETGQISGFVV